MVKGKLLGSCNPCGNVVEKICFFLNTFRTKKKVLQWTGLSFLENLHMSYLILYLINLRWSNNLKFDDFHNRIFMNDERISSAMSTKVEHIHL